MCRSAGLQTPPKLRANDQCPHFERLTFAREEFGNMHFSFAENIPFRCYADLVRALSFPLGPSSEDVISTPQLFMREEGLKSACLEALMIMSFRKRLLQKEACHDELSSSRIPKQTMSCFGNGVYYPTCTVGSSYQPSPGIEGF